MSMLSQLFWGKKPEEAQVTPHQAQRQKQIDSLKQQHRKIIEVSRDSSYRIPFSVGAQTFFLDVSLTVMFPRDPPILRLTPRGSHPWVDSNGTINSPKMTAFSMHSDMGRLIGEIIEEFQRNPPLIPRDIPPSDGVSSLYPNTSTFPSFPVPSVPRRSDSPNFPPFATPIRTVDPLFSSFSDNFPDIKNKSDADLQGLVDESDEKALFDKISSTPVIASLRDEAKRLMEYNSKLAEENVSRKQYLEQAKSDLFDKYSLAGGKRQEFDDLQRKQEAVIRKYDPTMLQEQLRIAAADAEGESEVIADEFLSGKLDLESFLPKFIENRKISHHRRALEDCLNKQQKTGLMF